MYPKKMYILLLALLITSFLIPGCGDNQATDTADPPRNLKLDSFLNRLILAEEQGEAEEFARKGGVELVDGSVRVIIECVPGQIEAAAEAAGAFGIVELTVRRGVQAVIPIANLNALAESESIHLVRLPWEPSEE